VSEAHRAARRRQILDAARTCFARSGFHRATMHDVVREAGLSAGLVYRYFRGKQDLVAALARERHGRERALLRAFLAPLEEPDAREERRLGIQLWAEALGDPKLRRVVRAGVAEPKRRIAALIRRAKRRGALPASLDADATARLAIAVFHGIVLQQAWEPDLDVPRIAATAEALLGQGRLEPGPR
jgi:AcrR family transcriptional regulator